MRPLDTLAARLTSASPAQRPKLLDGARLQFASRWNTRGAYRDQYTEIDGLDDGRTMFAIVSFEGVLNFTAEGRLYYRIGAHLHRYTLLDVDGTLPRSISTPSRDRLSVNLVDDFDD